MFLFRHPYPKYVLLLCLHESDLEGLVLVSSFLGRLPQLVANLRELSLSFPASLADLAELLSLLELMVLNPVAVVIAQVHDKKIHSVIGSQMVIRLTDLDVVRLRRMISRFS